MRYTVDADFADLRGKTLKSIEKIEKVRLLFHTDSGETFQMFHRDYCCETVEIEDVCGDLDDLLHSPILVAEEVTGAQGKPLCETDESYTWTFYKLATIKGAVTIRWYGTSNGNYSEEVNFVEVKEEEIRDDDWL